MSQFIYFVPGWAKPVMTQDDAVKIGLGHMLDGGDPTCMSNVKGPDDQVGAVITAGKGGRCKYEPKKQTWRKGPKGEDGKPRYWLGVITDDKPKAADLLRSKSIAGTEVTLLDGGAWTIPVAASRTGGGTLPMRMQLDDDEKWVGKPLAIYDELCTAAAKAYDTIFSSYAGSEKETEVSFQFDDIMKMVIPAMQVNYRVAAREVAMLEVMGDREMFAVLKAMCDWDSFTKVLEERSKNGDASGT